MPIVLLQKNKPNHGALFAAMFFISLIVFVFGAFFVDVQNIQAAEKVKIEIQNPLTGEVDSAISVSTLIGAVIKAVLGLIGSIALLVFVVAGLIWLTSQGDEKKINKARSALMWAALGLLAVFSSYIVLNNILNVFSGEVIQKAASSVDTATDDTSTDDK